MRVLVIILLALLATPVLGKDWGHYDNARFGYSIDIPPGFGGPGESDNGDGQILDRPDKAQVLYLWGGALNSDLTTQVADSIGYAERDGWKLAEHTGTPRWAEFAAVNGSRRFWQRIVLLCDGQSYGTVQLQYSAVDAGDIVPVIDRLKRSFQAASC